MRKFAVTPKTAAEEMDEARQARAEHVARCQACRPMGGMSPGDVGTGCAQGKNLYAEMRRAESRTGVRYD
jgi:hypothetical protein